MASTCCASRSSRRDSASCRLRRPRPTRPSVRTRDATPPTSSPRASRDRKSTRLNSSHGYISYAVFCLKKKKKKDKTNDKTERRDHTTHKRRRSSDTLY